MTRAKQAVCNIIEDIANKSVLEVACGCAEFSINASEFASHVSCIDLDSFRLDDKIHVCGNVSFQQMDARSLQYNDKEFDTVVIYNAVFHLKEFITEILSECKRVIGDSGCIYVISSFKMDKAVINEELVPLLNEVSANFSVKTDKMFTYVKIKH